MKTKIIQKVDYVKSSDDFELSIKRDKDVEYLYSYPQDTKLRGIVFIIPGFGEDTNSEYGQKLRDYIAQKFSVVAVHVLYHCFYSRMSNGASAIMDEVDREILFHHLKRHNLKITSNTINDILKEIDKAISKKKNNKEIDSNLKFIQTMTISPKNDEYQNFGILQALDHINVLQDIREKKLDFVDKYPTILMGSSHGAYIAYLISKFTPNLIDCVIDNSSYIKPPLNYIIGKAKDISRPEFRIIMSDNIVLNYFVKTHWNNEKDSYFYFSNDRCDIRDLSNVAQLKTMALSAREKMRYVSYHSRIDKIAPIEDKINYFRELKELGFDASLNIINDDSQVDGEFIKSLDHGLGMSIKQLANIELPKALEIRSNSSRNKIENISYQCDTLNYEFQNIDGVFTALQSPVFSIEDTIVTTYQKNIEYFQKHQPKIYSKLASFDSAVEQGLYENRYDLVFNNNYLDVKELSSNNYLYITDSKKYAYEAANSYSSHVDKFIFFGVGLGLHIISIDKKISSQSYLIVEDDLELFKLSIFATPYYELGSNSKLYFSIFDNDEEFAEVVKMFLKSSEQLNQSLLHYSMSNHSQNKKAQLEEFLGLS